MNESEAIRLAKERFEMAQTNEREKRRAHLDALRAHEDAEDELTAARAALIAARKTETTTEPRS